LVKRLNRLLMGLLGVVWVILDGKAALDPLFMG